LQHWDHWLAQEALGSALLNAEKKTLSPLLSQHFGKHAVLIGVPQQASLGESTPLTYHTLVSPLLRHEKTVRHHIESDLHELPLLAGSADLVLLPHTLEFVDNPRQLLSEACRIVKPEGLIVVCGFNPYSYWGMKKKLQRKSVMPWAGNLIYSYQVKNWLQLADFQLEQQHTCLFRPFIRQQKIYQQLHFMEKIGKILFPAFGNIYILLARAKVIPLTPIKMQWKQSLKSIRISTSTGYIARQNNENN
jgi:SAM-dependent methyltransferase